MRKFGLIGYPLSHSFSPGYFKSKFEKEGIRGTEYRAYPISNVSALIEIMEDGVEGLNVTIPYKEQVLELLDAVEDTAAAIGAVNTIKVENGKLVGYNTDIYGFEVSLLDFLAGEIVDKALILGSGGASKAVRFVLNKLGIKFTLISRNKNYLNYNEISKSIMESHPLVVNTTPLGMSPDIDACPLLPYESVSEKHFFYDLIYNPEKTLFLKKAEQQGAKIKNGKDMLYLQAEKSWQIWNHH